MRLHCDVMIRIKKLVEDQNMVVLPIVGGQLAMLVEENLPSKYNVNEMKSISLKMKT